MKGIIFTEFLALVEDKFGMDMVDQIIEMSDLPGGGSYTSVGTYSHQEMNKLVESLSSQSGIPADELLFIFGEYLFGKLAKAYPDFVKSTEGLLSFLESIEHHIHVQVKKLYPDAELPSFQTKRLSSNSLEMIYESERKYHDLAMGLISGAMKHFESVGNIDKDTLPNGTTRFTITLK